VPASRTHEWSVAPTLAWFVAILGGALLAFDGGVGGIRALVDREPGADDDELLPQLAGPAFVREEAKRAVLPTDEELDEALDEAIEDEPADDQVVAPGETPAIKPVRAPIEDVCVDGTADACTRWAMDGVYEALGRAEHADGVARMSLWGDSVTAEGYIADGMRLKLAHKYGDGGAGWIFLAKPSRWYQNTAVRQTQSPGWVVHSIIHNGDPDGYHGFGGARFDGTNGDVATFRTAKSGVGAKVARAELWYLAHPQGGEADLYVDGELVQHVDSKADAIGSGFASLDVADGAHTIKVQVTSGRFRAFGMVMERATGAVVDSLGVVSNTAKNLGGIDDAHWREQIAHRDADLMMVLLGANESRWMNGKKALKEYDARWRKVLGRIRGGNPDGACLVIGTMDAGTIEGGKFVGRPAIDGMIKVQRAVAHAEGCAFWDARAYMGGKDASRAWFKKGLMSGDFEHLTKKGGKVLGSAIVEALEAGYAHHHTR